MTWSLNNTLTKKKKVSIPKDDGWAWCPVLNTVMVSADVINSFCETDFYAGAYELRIQHLIAQANATHKCGRLLCNKEMFLKFFLNNFHVICLINLVPCQTRYTCNTISRASKMSVKRSPTKTPYLREEIPPPNTRDHNTQLILAVL
jgi:hypothetical protein